MRVKNRIKYFAIAVLISFLSLSFVSNPKIFPELVISNQSKKDSSQTADTSKEHKNPTPSGIKVLGTTNENEINQQTDKKISDYQKNRVSFDQQILYNLINSYRADNKITKLSPNKQLEDSASRKISDMITNEYYRHSDTNNNESWYLFQAAGYQYIYAGENLSFGYNSPWDVFFSWQNSPKHNEQLLKPQYLDMGIASNCTEYITNSTTSCIVVLHLGTKE